MASMENITPSRPDFGMNSHSTPSDVPQNSNSALSSSPRGVFTDQEVINCIAVPRLEKGDEISAQLSDIGSGNDPLPTKTRVLYRPNVSVHFFNERGQVLACCRKDGRSWQTVQGGIEKESDSVSAAYEFSFPIHSPCDPLLLQTAVREVSEEIGLADLASVGCEFITSISPPSRTELESVLNQRTPRRRLKDAEKVQLDLLEHDRMRFFRYEFQGGAGAKARKRRHIGQEQHQLVFFLPSTSISKINLVPDEAVVGPGVSAEFKDVAWMTVNEYIPLVAPFKRSIGAYVLTCAQYREAVSTFLASKTMHSSL